MMVLVGCVRFGLGSGLGSGLGFGLGFGLGSGLGSGLGFGVDADNAQGVQRAALLRLALGPALATTPALNRSG